ncbi:ParB family protein [Pseudomonas guariconensis]|uniref:ParB family protein n=1 Tax=Pseudomonas guariconensis TaxID=1288410 RepID=UPI003906A1B0
MKPPTSEDVTRQLLQTHFPQKSREHPANPVGETAMVVTLEQLRPYELNPRVVRNPLYDELKASIRERGLDHPPSITRRPNEQHFIIRNGGNTRLSILSELWQETREERFFRLNCLFRPWQSESHALLGHLAESDLHGQLTFIERALAVAKLLDMLQEPGEALSQRELATRLSKGGYPVSQSNISRMFDAIEFLLPSIPQVLYAGLGKPNIERVISLRRRAESTWNQYFGDPQQFALLWMEVLTAFDDEKPELDASELQDELIAKMAVYLNQSPRVLALDFHQDTGSLQSAAAAPQEAAGLAFLEWLRDGIHTHRLVVNDSKAKVHTVNGMLFLVTPGIFQLYITEHPESANGHGMKKDWRSIQRHFEKMGIHLKLPNGQNIWTCSVQGPRKTSLLNGYLIRNVNIICSTPPASNKFLTLHPVQVQSNEHNHLK